MQHNDQSISSFHEHLAITKQTPEILSTSLFERKITPEKYIQTMYRNQYQNVISPISDSRLYASLLPPLNQRLYTPAVALKTDAPDWLCADLAKILITIQLAIKYIVLDCKGESDAVWQNVDDSATLFELRPKTVALCANNRSFFAGLTFHELAHVALNHSNIRTLTKRTFLSSAQSTSNQSTMLQKLCHLQEFEADSHFTARSLAATQGLCGLLSHSATVYNILNSESLTHPTLKRRIAALKAQEELLKCSSSCDLD